MRSESITVVETGEEFRLSYSYDGPDGTIEIEGVGDSLPEALNHLAEEIEWAHESRVNALSGGINILGGGSLSE